MYCLLLINAASHIFQDRRADMLQWKVYIITDSWFIVHQVEQLIWETLWITVMKSNPLELFYFEKSFHQLNDMILSVDITTIICQILSYEDKFFNAFLCEQLCFFNKICHWNRDVFATNQWYRAESTASVAAFRNL